MRIRKDIRMGTYKVTIDPKFFDGMENGKDKDGVNA